MRVGYAAGSVCAVAVLLAGCGSGGDPAGAPGRDGADKTVTVFAAASLTEAFTALEKRFEADHPGVDVKVNFAGSSALAQQINEGAQADVFASADDKNMEKVTDHIDGQVQVFARNRLVIVTPAGNPAGITGLADLTKGTLVVCAPQVPCGAASRKVAEVAKVELKPVSEEQDVKAVLTKVRAGEADAGLVYVSDAKAAGAAVTTVDFPESRSVVNNYPITALRGAGDLDRQFVALVVGDTGKKELAAAGFEV